MYMLSATLPYGAVDRSPMLAGATRAAAAAAAQRHHALPSAHLAMLGGREIEKCEQATPKWHSKNGATPPRHDDARKNNGGNKLPPHGKLSLLA